jgi:dCTP deaminase
MKFEQNGALASQHLKQLIDESVISLDSPADSDQIQPASIDLRLGSIAYRVRASFLPGKDRKVSDCLE